MSGLHILTSGTTGPPKRIPIRTQVLQHTVLSITVGETPCSDDPPELVYWPPKTRCVRGFSVRSARRTQPMNRAIDSATAAGLSEPSTSTVTATVACTAPSSLATLAISARARSLAPTFTGVMKRTLL
jgi:hypothetical protein